MTINTIILFILEFILFMGIFVILFNYLIFRPIHWTFILIRLLITKITGKKLMLRAELVALGLHKPGTGYWDEDVNLRICKREIL